MAKINTLSHEKVRLTEGFWKNKRELGRNVTLMSIYDRFAETGRFASLDFNHPNPHIFWDSDIAKWVESAAFILEKNLFFAIVVTSASAGSMPPADLVARIDRMDLLERQEEQQARHARADSCLGDRQIRRLEDDPYDGHDHGIRHVDNDAGEQILRHAHGNRAHDQKQQHQLNDDTHTCSSFASVSISSGLISAAAA